VRPGFPGKIKKDAFCLFDLLEELNIPGVFADQLHGLADLSSERIGR
jgi:hypothetical protein